MICKYAEIFCWKNVSSFCIFQQNIRILCIKSAKTVNEITLNELVKLTTLWTTGPRLFYCSFRNVKGNIFIYVACSSVKPVLSPFWKWIHSKSKETRFFFFRVEQFLEGALCVRNQSGSHKHRSHVKSRFQGPLVFVMLNKLRCRSHQLINMKLINYSKLTSKHWPRKC